MLRVLRLLLRRAEMRERWRSARVLLRHLMRVVWTRRALRLLRELLLIDARRIRLELFEVRMDRCLRAATTE